MAELKYFLSKQRILIADDSAATRVAIARIFSELGATTALMSLADSFDAAKNLATQKRFSIFICEYNLGDRCGLDLLPYLSQLKLSAVVTRNQTDLAMAHAAERDVDIFLTKPFTIDQFKDAIANAIQLRTEGNAESELSLSLERIARSQAGERAYDRVSYRALARLFELLTEQGNKEDAYAVLRKLVMNFPIHPERLNAALRLAIETRHFEDIESLYGRFLSVETKGADLVRHMYSALVVAGKAFGEAGDLDRAVEHFKKAAHASSKKLSVLREVILSLVAWDQAKSAEIFINMVLSHDRQNTEFYAIDYLVMSKLRPVHAALQRGRELLKSGHSDPLIYQVLIYACNIAGHKAEAESLSLDAARLWPTRVDEYQSLIQSPSAL